MASEAPAHAWQGAVEKLLPRWRDDPRVEAVLLVWQPGDGIGFSGIRY